MRNKLTDELAVCGLNAVKALAELHPEKVNRLFLREERLPLLGDLCRGLAARKRPYKICEDEELERICKSSHHQGVAAMIYEPVIENADETDLEAWAAAGRTCILLCDVGNDHNFGAIVRAAAFFDAALILTEGIEITTSACRVAEGGMEHVAFRRIHSPQAFLRDASRALVSIGTDPRARLRIRDLPRLIQDRSRSLAASTKNAGALLVLGNEETGLPDEIKKCCSLLVRIPGSGALESLNVAQAAALFLQELFER